MSFRWSAVILLAGCASAPIRGEVVGSRMAGGAHEVPDTEFDVVLVNDGKAPCRISRYTVVWGEGLLAGRKTCNASVVLTAGDKARQTCIVPSGGPLGGTPGLGSPHVGDIYGLCEAQRINPPDTSMR